MISRSKPVRASAAIAAMVLAAMGVVAALGSNDDGTPPRQRAGQPSSSPEPETPGRKPAKAQSPATWVDTRLAKKRGPETPASWVFLDPLGTLRDAWSDVVAEHLEPSVGELHLSRQGWLSSPMDWRGEASGTFGILVDDGDGRLVGHGCRLALWRWRYSLSHCREHRLEGPRGEDAWIMEMPGRALVLVERARGAFGYVEAHWERGRDAPVPLDDMVAAAADPRITLPAKAFGVPRNSTVAAVVHDHVPNLVPDLVAVSELGIGEILAPGPFPWFGVRVVPAGPKPPCAREGPSYCIARQVYGAGDPTTVYLAGSKKSASGLVYVGPRNTVRVYISDIDADARLQKRLIDLVLDPRLQ